MLLNLKWICCTLIYDSECIVYSSETFTSIWDWEPCWFPFQSFHQVLTYGQFKPKLARWNLLTLCVKTHEIQEIMRAGIQAQAAGINIINRLARVSRIWQIYTIFYQFLYTIVFCICIPALVSSHPGRTFLSIQLYKQGFKQSILT